MRLSHGIAMGVLGIIIGAGLSRSVSPAAAPTTPAPPRAPEPPPVSQPARNVAITPEVPPSPPADFVEPPHDSAPVAVEANPEETKSSDPRARGLVLWKGEWMQPEERAAKRKAEDDAKAAFNAPRAHASSEPPPDDNPIVDNQQLAPGQFRQVGPSGRADFVGPEGGVYHYSKNGNKVYEKRR